MTNNPLPVLRMQAKVFEDGMLGIKGPTDLTPGEYEAVVVLQRVVPVGPPHVECETPPLESMERFIERMRREHLEAALARAGGNRTQAAKLLGVDARTVFRLLGKEGGL
jgi:transcriptional regulator with GAF, ATPase, and Fis domain